MLQFLLCLPRVSSRQYLFIYFIRRKFPSSKIIYCLLPRKIYPHEKSCLPDCFRIFHVLAAETLSLIVYVTKWPFISLLNLWFLFVNISGKLFSINNHFKIPLFQVFGSNLPKKSTSGLKQKKWTPPLNSACSIYFKWAVLNHMSFLLNSCFYLVSKSTQLSIFFFPQLHFYNTIWSFFNKHSSRPNN